MTPPAGAGGGGDGDGGEKPKKPRKSRRTPLSSTATPSESDPVRAADEPVRRADSPKEVIVTEKQVIVAERETAIAEDRHTPSSGLTTAPAPTRATSEPPTAAEPRTAAGAPEERPPLAVVPEARPPRARTVEPVDDVPSPEWPLGDSERAAAPPASAPPPPTPEPAPPPPTPVALMPDPKAAALEAARIVGEIVGDIESAGGAAIVAAAAAGAAIEAARARSRAVAEGADPAAAAPAAPSEPTAPPTSPDGSDPVTTVRMARDRILRALAEDVAAQAEAQAAGEQAAAAAAQGATAPSPPSERERAPSQPGRAPSHPGRAPTNPPSEKGAPSRPSAQGIPRPPETAPAAQPGQEPAVPEEEEEFDPVQIAAAAIQKLRQRAKTDLAELRTHYHRHDIVVLVLAFVMIIVAARVHRNMVTPPTATFSERGLVFEHSKAWLLPEPVPAYSPRIVHDLGGQPTQPKSLYHVEFTSSLDPSARMEVLIDKKPAWSNIVTGLELDRRTRWGELYLLEDSAVKPIAGHDWLRTDFRYAHVGEKGDIPRVDHAVEYATIDRDQIYVITLYGTESEIDRIEDVVAPSLRVPTQTGLPLVPQTRMLADRTYPNAVARAFDSTVMVVAADLVDGRLRPRGGGSGVVVGGDGSILTNYHVIHDKDGRLHDVFVIGRFSQPDHAPLLWCAGRPNRSKLQRDLDLALIKCDLDLDGRAWTPTNGTVWATLPEARTADVKMGQRLWVLGYPDVGGGGLMLNEGQVEGWTGEDGAAGKDFIKTDASITHGNSGGPVVDDHGRLVGIAAAFRTRTTPSGNVIETSQVGLVRPLSTASCLLAIATVGWTPRENHTDCDLEPSAIEAPAEGVRISSKVLDAASEAPVRDALVMILRPGVKKGAVDVNRLDDQVLSWGRSNAQGEVQLKQPVPIPGTYTVMIVAKGYEPLVGDGELHLDANTPPFFDPWGKIWLRSR